MSRPIYKLSAPSLSRLIRPGYYGDGGNLYLQVKRSGAKSWIFRYTIAGQRQDMGLGSFVTFSLKEAREKARINRQLVDARRDPRRERDLARTEAKLEAEKAVTFQECAERYIASHEAGWSLNYAKQWKGSLSDYVYKVFGGLPVRAVDVSHVMKVLEPIWTTRPGMAPQLRGRIENILNWAKVQDYRSGENPARWRGHLQNLLPRISKVHRVKNHPALPHKEVSSFISALRQQDSLGALPLEFTILTAARTGEAIGATWKEIDFGERVWTVPAERMKAGEIHEVPLSSTAMKILDRMQEIRASDFVFPGRKTGRPIGDNTMIQLLKRIGRENVDVTVHGFRSAFRDWAGDCTEFKREDVEMCIAHKVGSKVELSYRRSTALERRRKIMEAWAEYCLTPAAVTTKVAEVGETIAANLD
jgi:integrase